MKHLKEYIIAILVSLLAFSGCNRQQNEDEPDYGSVTIETSNEDRIGYFKYLKSIDKDGNENTDSLDEGFTVSEDGDLLKLTMEDTASDQAVEVELVREESDNDYKLLTSNEGSFRFDPYNLWWVMTADDGTTYYYEKAVEEYVERSDLMEADVVVGDSYLEIGDDTIDKIIEKAEEEGINYQYVDSASDISVVMLPIPTVDGDFNGTHLMVWLVDGTEPGDIASLYFDGTYGAREVSIIGYRRNYIETMTVLKDRIDDFKKNEDKPVTRELLKSIVDKYKSLAESEEVNESVE